MNNSKVNYFDQSAANWDAEPRRVELAKAVGKAILCQVQPTRDMDVLDYGCGTGLLGLFLLPHVRSVTGADSSPGMLQVLEDKIRIGGLQQMRAERLDLEHDPVPNSCYHLIAANMVMHHIDQTELLLAAFYQMLLPDGFLAIADLDTEPGLFHAPDVASSVHHQGFERSELKSQLARIGFKDAKDITAHIIRKPVEGGKKRDFPIFLISARK